ncbi:MAG: response regulator, partial [Abitibacteriaceae bacterium]|nr:response regulator [Abditibacteriaceae bacterium]
GYDATIVENGDLARQAVEQQLFDVIILDIEMPGADGLTAARQIRKLPNGQSVPIVLLTAYNYTLRTAEQVGANLLVRKPILAQDLVQKIRELVEGEG